MLNAIEGQIGTLSAPWYTLIVPDGVDPDLPGIYQWEIDGVGTYIGKYTRKSRPFREYEANVLKILEGRPYRPRKPDSFRAVHRALWLGHATGRSITLTILENCAPEALLQRETELAKERGTLNGPRGRKVLEEFLRRQEPLETASGSVRIDAV